jgi:hypothetical protein
MHTDLAECIATARAARDRVLDQSLPVQVANAVAANNATIVTAHALNLRMQLFEAERRQDNILAPPKSD